MLVVAGLSLSNLKPRVWDPRSEHYLPKLRAVMVSYADFHGSPIRTARAMQQGIHKYLGVPEGVKVYLDNGAFCLMAKAGRTPTEEYGDFVECAKPDWYPIPQDFIPTPRMSLEEQQQCFRQTMRVNEEYQGDGYVPVIHVSQFLEQYLVAVQGHERLSAKQAIALGGLVPNLLRASKAIPYEEILSSLKRVREAFGDKEIHVFGVGGTATLHLMALLGMDSVDSSGWRNRAARGLVQLLGRGDRMVAELGNWRGRRPSKEEWESLGECPCPACRQEGLDGLKASGIDGFCHRATHNLWTLLEEAELVQHHLATGTYGKWYGNHLENSVYRPLVDRVVAMAAGRVEAGPPAPSLLSAPASTPPPATG